MAFDPDAYLAKKVAPSGFDPDAYLAKKAAPQESAPNPVESMSGAERWLAGAGAGMSGMVRGAKQAGLEIAQGLGADKGVADYIPTVGALKAITNTLTGGEEARAQQAEQLRQEQAQAEQLEAPLMATGTGRAGNVTGMVASALPTMFIPGANTYTGAALVGAGTGFLQPTSDQNVLASKAKDAAIGAGAGVAGQAIGQGIGAIAKNYAARKAAEQAAQKSANAVKDATVASAKQAGYVIPPVQVNPSAANRLLEGFAGKITTGQSASIKNQEVTNRLVKRALGVAEDQPLTPQVLSGIRAEAGKVYESMRGAGQIATDAQYADDLSKIVAKYQGAGKDFPGLARNEIADTAEMIGKPEFNSDSALDAISILRDKADKAFRAGDKSFGRAYKQMADSMEGVIERNIAAAGDDAAALLKDFRDARQLIAKTYSVESALNQATGNINAKKLAQMLNRGKPLSGELKEVGRFAQAFPKAAEEVTSSMPGVSPLDYATAGIGAAASGNPSLLASILGRPAIRSTILSQPYQSMMVNPQQYGPNLLQQSAPLLQSDSLNALLRLAPPSVYAVEK